MSKKQIKNSELGVTLVALVITIIVLLILAGVAISAIVKDDGIINKADSAKKETVKGDIKDRLYLAVQELTIDTLGDEITKNQLQEKLTQVFTESENPTITEDEEKFVVTVANETFEVTKTGGVTEGNNPSTGGDEEGITAEEVAANVDMYYGKTVNNYILPDTIEEDITWRIFHSDGENIYLIASDYVQKAPGITGTEYRKSFAEVVDNYGYNVEGKKWIDTDISTNSVIKWIDKNENDEYDAIYSSSDAMKQVAYMLDTSIWNTLYKDTQGFAEYAIGGPTLKMYVESYNLTHEYDIKYKYVEDDNYYKGYSFNEDMSKDFYVGEGKEIDGLYINKNNDGAMRIASPNLHGDFVIVVSSDGTDNTGFIGGSVLNVMRNACFSPVVCLSSEVSLEQVGEGDDITFALKK